MATPTTSVPPVRPAASGRSRAEQCRQNAREKSARKRRDTIEALRRLRSKGEPISRSRVAKRAGVSLPFLRSHPDLLQAIDEAGAGQRAAAPLPPSGETASEHRLAALQRRLEGKDRIIAERDEEIRRLKADNATLYGRLLAHALPGHPAGQR